MTIRDRFGMFAAASVLYLGLVGVATAPPALAADPPPIRDQTASAAAASAPDIATATNDTPPLPKATEDEPSPRDPVSADEQTPTADQMSAPTAEDLPAPPPPGDLPALPAIDDPLAPLAPAAEPPAVADASKAVATVVDWVVRSDDNQGMPFVIIDKIDAEVFVFGADGDLKGRGRALLGVARGDDSAPGVGDIAIDHIPMQERTTPAGRFIASFGPAAGGKSVLWVDYKDAISLHPVVTSNPEERRPERLRSPTADDKRITHGCINVSAAFYRQFVQPTFADTQGVVYILPEVSPLEAVFPALAAEPGEPGAVARDGVPSPALAQSSRPGG